MEFLKKCANIIKWTYKSSKTISDLPFFVLDKNKSVIPTLIECLTIGSEYIYIKTMDSLILASLYYTGYNSLNGFHEKNDILCENIINMINKKKTTITYKIGYPMPSIQLNYCENNQQSIYMGINIKISNIMYLNLLKKKYCLDKYIKLADRDTFYESYYDSINDDVLVILTNYGSVNAIMLQNRMSKIIL